jgi:tripartite-type tricarboxylate transporter receptor subunit TctC
MGDLLSGEVHMTFGAIAAMTSHIQSRRLRGIAVSSLKPSPLLPDLPTVSAAGVPGYEALSILGIWAPAGTPDATINLVHGAVVRVLQRPDVKEKFLATGVEPIGSTPEAFAAKIKSEMAKWAKVFRDVGIQPQ